MIVILIIDMIVEMIIDIIIDITNIDMITIYNNNNDY